MSDTSAGLLQIGLLVGALALCYRPLGDYLARVYTSEKDLARRARHLPRRRGRSTRRPAVAGLRDRRGRLLPRRGAAALRPAAVPVRAPTVVGVPGRRPRSGVQHRSLVRDQHQLAGLLGRGHDGPPHADGRPGGPELRLRRRGNLRRGRPDPWLHPIPYRPGRQLLGRPGAHDRARAHPARRDRHRCADRDGSRAEPQLRDRGHDCHRRSPDDHRRTGGVPGGHQGARHQRRRLLQRQLRPSRSRTPTR